MLKVDLAIFEIINDVDYSYNKKVEYVCKHETITWKCFFFFKLRNSYLQE